LRFDWVPLVAIGDTLGVPVADALRGEGDSGEKVTFLFDEALPDLDRPPSFENSFDAAEDSFGGFVEIEYDPGIGPVKAFRDDSPVAEVGVAVPEPADSLLEPWCIFR